MILDDKTECIPSIRKKERKYKPMSDTILALLGFATVIAVIVLLLRNVTGAKISVQ